MKAVKIGIDFKAGENCTQGQIQTYNETSQTWECADFASVIDVDSDGVLAWNDCDDSNGNINQK